MSLPLNRDIGFQSFSLSSNSNPLRVESDARPALQAAIPAKRLLSGVRQAERRFSQFRKNFGRVDSDSDSSEDNPQRFSHALEDVHDTLCQIRPARPGESLAAEDQYLKERAKKNYYVNEEATKEDATARDGVKEHQNAREMIVAAFKETAKQEEEKLVLERRGVLSADLCRDTRRGVGDQRLDDIRKLLNSMGVTRSQFQRMFHDAFIRAILPIIYGDEWSSCCERVMKDHGIDRIRPEVLIQTPRRFGKTVSVALFVLACLLCIPRVRICIFSTGKRASGGLMTELLSYLKNIPGGRRRIVKSNSEQLWLSQTELAEGQSMNSLKTKEISGNEVGRLYSFPASVAGQSKTTKHWSNPSLSKRSFSFDLFVFLSLYLAFRNNFRQCTCHHIPES